MTGPPSPSPAPEATARPDPVPADAVLLGFTRALREAGVSVTPDRSRTYLEAVAAVGLGDRRATYHAGRATLCASPDDLRVYDEVFAAWFAPTRTDDRTGPRRARAEASRVRVALPTDGTDDEGDGTTALASEVEKLGRRDVATLSPAERARLGRLFATLRPHPPRRVSSRRSPARRGQVDPRATLRRAVRRHGEPVEIAWQRRTSRRRRVVLLLDVSGSMSAYADTLLRLAHRVVMGTGPGVEAFTVGTRVTRVTRALQVRDADAALVAAGRSVPDWSGGTRLGETLHVFLDRWGRRGVARGAVVVIFSDGWERGDPAELAEQMRRLHLLAHTVVWANPHKGDPGYQPLQQGMVAALPHVDHFVAGHSLAAFADLLAVVADA